VARAAAIGAAALLLAACAQEPQRPAESRPATIFAPAETGPLPRAAQFVVVVPRQGEDLASLAERYRRPARGSSEDRRVQPDGDEARRRAVAIPSRRSTRAASSLATADGADPLLPPLRHARAT
jgi:hypothetical protein